MQHAFDMKDFNMEVQRLRGVIERKTADKTLPFFDENKSIGFAKFVASYWVTFYQLNKLVQITCTIPIICDQAERSFSCLKVVDKVTLKYIHD